MSKAVKIPLIVGAIMIGVGIIIVLAVGFSSGWNYKAANWEEKVYQCEESNNINELDIDFPAGALKVEFYDGEKIKVEYSESEQITTEFKVTDGKLKISSIVHWHVQFLWFNKIPETRIYIPQNMILGLNMDIDAGTVKVGDGAFANIYIKMSAGTLDMNNVLCNSFDLNMSAGTLKISQIQCGTFKSDLSAGKLSVDSLNCGDIDVDISAGNVTLNVAGNKSDYTIRTNVSAGKCNVSNQSGGDKKLTVDVSAGKVTVNFDPLLPSPMVSGMGH